MHKVHSVFALCVVVFSMFFNISGVWAAQLEELIFPMEEIIVIASKYPEELIDSLASVETISREEITICGRKLSRGYKKCVWPGNCRLRLSRRHQNGQHSWFISRTGSDNDRWSSGE